MNEEDLLIEDSQSMSLPQLQEVILQFQDQLNSLNYQVTNKNFGSKIYQTKETIASKARFVAGFKDDVVIMDGQDPTWRFWAGKADAATAPFRVDKDGNVVATSMTLSGYLQVGQAAGDTASTITGLASLSSNLGTITAGSISGITITGSLFRTASSGNRIEITSTPSNKISFYNGTDEIGYLEVTKTGDAGSLKLYSADGAAGLELVYNVAASQFTELSLGGFTQGGTSSNGGIMMVDSSGTAQRAFGLSHTSNGTPYIDLTGFGGYVEAQFQANLIPNVDASYDLGSASRRWGIVYATNISGTNTGDETESTIKSKLGISTLSGSNTGDQDLSTYMPKSGGTFTGNVTADQFFVNWIRISGSNPDIGTSGSPFRNVFCQNLGSGAAKVTVYCDGLTACPLPITPSALSKVKTLRHKKLAPGKGHYGDHLNYLDVDEAPAEMKKMFKRDEEDGGGEFEDIDIIKTVGFLYSCVKEIQSEIDSLKIKK